MRAIAIFVSLMAVALARPDVSHLTQGQEYQYNKPSTAFEPTGSTGAIAGPSKGGYNNGNNQFAGSSNNYNTESYQGSSDQSSADFGQSRGGYSGNAQQQGFGSQSNGQSGSFGGQQSGSFGGQSGSGSGFSGQSGSGFGGQSGSGSGFSGQSGSGFGGQSGSGSGFGGQSSGSFGGQSSGQSQSSSGSSSGGFTSGGGFSSGGSGNLYQGQSQSIDLTGGSSGGDRVVYKPVIKQGEPIITKNFYVHAAPEEDENVRVEEKVQVVRPQKSYKIIFIKAPSSGSSFNAANYPVYPQNEEKTIVYVLSKKDDSVSDFGEIPTPPPAVTHKPEVYFIKYKTKQEAAAAVANIQSQYKGDSGATVGDFGSTGSDSGYPSSGSSNFGSTGSSNGFGATGSDSGSFGSTGSSGGNYASSGTTSDLSLQNFRGENQNEDSSVDLASFVPTANGNGSQSPNYSSSSSSSGSSFGPSGGQISLQSGAFGPQGGSSVSHSQQLDSSGQIKDQSTSFGNGNEIVPQNIVRVDDESAFAGLQNYLPPN